MRGRGEEDGREWEREAEIERGRERGGRERRKREEESK